MQVAKEIKGMLCYQGNNNRYEALIRPAVESRCVHICLFVWRPQDNVPTNTQTDERTKRMTDSLTDRLTDCEQCIHVFSSFLLPAVNNVHS